MLKYKEEVGQLQVVTKISQQKRSSNRFNVYLDNEYAFGISEDVYVTYQLYKGKELTAEQIETIKQADDVQQAYIIAINYLSYRMRTETEIRTHLRKKDLVHDVIERAIELLYQEELLDDSIFAETFVRDRINRSTKGPKVIRQELAQKGIDKGIIDEALKTYTRDKQMDKAFKLGEKEAQKSSRHPVNRRKDQMKSRLLRRGFTHDVIHEVVDMLDFNVDDEKEFLLLKNEADKLYTRYKNKHDDYELKMRLKQRLYSRGFPLNRINSYIETLFDDQ